MNLSELKSGKVATIIGVNGDTTTIKRLVEMGFVKGREIRAIKSAPLKDPVEYELMGYNISLRRREAEMVEIVDQDIVGCECNHCGCGDSLCGRRVTLRKRNHGANNVINVAIVGNPNCGKTTLYNSMAGRHEHTGNYAGVTVGSKVATLHHEGFQINLTDLPGIYSLTSSVAEEAVVCEVLANNQFDFVINVVDSTLLERNMFLTTQLMDMGQHVIVALNMYDELVEMGDKFDINMLSTLIGLPLVPTIAGRGVGAIELLDIIVKRHTKEEDHSHIETNMGLSVEDALAEVVAGLEGVDLYNNFSKRYVAMMLLDRVVQPAHLDEAAVKLCDRKRAELESEYDEPINQIFANARYGYISGALRETHTSAGGDRHPKSTKIDNLMTHKIWGFPIFIFIMWAMFYAVFTLGAPLQDLIDSLVGFIADGVSAILPDGAIRDFVLDGVIGGVGSVIIFLPNILILFLCIALLEDSGYMARAAFIMDRLMHKIGLHGKSFIPLIMGFGCNVPAIMATRIIEDKKNRMVTMLILPFMSCSARLPVYLLLVGAFFPQQGAFMLLGIYLSGILLAILSALIFRKILFTTADQPFVMELPPYRIPSAFSVFKHMWIKGSQYLKKMGGVILIGSALIWGLSYYPTQENSYLKDIGHAIEPAIKPLGFDWKIGVSLVSGVAAKEIVIGTMGVLHNVSDSDESGLALELQSATNELGEPIYTTATVLSLLAFVLIYFPCVAVVAAIKRESGRWRWALFSMFYTTAVAWVVSFVIYNIMK